MVYSLVLFQKQMDAESRVSTLERLNKDLSRQILEIQDNLETETRDKSTLMAKLRLVFFNQF